MQFSFLTMKTKIKAERDFIFIFLHQLPTMGMFQAANSPVFTGNC
jgi:hypothetical protein